MLQRYQWDAINLPYWQQRQRSRICSVYNRQIPMLNRPLGSGKKWIKTDSLTKRRKIRGQLEQQNGDTQLKQHNKQLSREWVMMPDSYWNRWSQTTGWCVAGRNRTKTLIGQTNDQKTTISNTANGCHSAVKINGHISHYNENGFGSARWLCRLFTGVTAGPNLVELFQQRLHKHTTQSWFRINWMSIGKKLLTELKSGITTHGI